MNKITVVQYLSVLASGGFIHVARRHVATPRVVRAPIRQGIGSRAQLVGSRGRGLLSPFCLPKSADGKRPVFKCPGSDLPHNCWRCRLVDVLFIYRYPMYIASGKESENV